MRDYLLVVLITLRTNLNREGIKYIAYEDANGEKWVLEKNEGAWEKKSYVAVKSQITEKESVLCVIIKVRHRC